MVARILPVLGVSAICMLVAPVAAQRPTDAAGEVDEREDAEYWRLIDEAVAEANAGRSSEALAGFRAAHGRRPSARTQRGMGLMYFALRDYVSAITRLSAALDDSRRPLDAEQRAEVIATRARAESYVARVELDVEPADAQIFCDGNPAVRDSNGRVLLNPGRHEIELVREGYEGDLRAIDAEPGGTHTLRVTLRTALHASDSGTLVQVVSEETELMLHAFPLDVDPALRPQSSAVCIAPCERRLPPGRYQLGIARRLQPPQSQGEHDILGATRVTLSLNDRTGWRIAGWVTLAGTLAVAGSLWIASGYVSSDQTGPMILAGFGVLSVGLSLSLTWAPLNDSMSLRVTPLEGIP